jgi:hypothetical protein
VIIPVYLLGGWMSEEEPENQENEKEHRKCG